MSSKIYMFQPLFHYTLYKGDQMWIFKWADTFGLQSGFFTDKTHQHCIFIFVQVRQSWEPSFSTAFPRSTPSWVETQKAGAIPVKTSGQTALPVCVNASTQDIMSISESDSNGIVIFWSYTPSELAHNSCWCQRELHAWEEPVRFSTVASLLLLIHPWVMSLLTAAIPW